MCISLCYIQNAHVLIFRFILSQISFLATFSSLAGDELTPQDIESPNASNRPWWWLRIRVGDIDEMANGYILESDDLGLLCKLIPEIEDQNDRDVDIRGDESFGLPAVFGQLLRFGIGLQKSEEQTYCLCINTV